MQSVFKNSIIFKKETMGKTQTERMGRWKKTQHTLFMKALDKYGKNWHEIQKVVKTRTITQVRSHAQKLFANMPKRDLAELEKHLNERFDHFCQSEQKKQKKTTADQTIQEVKIEDLKREEVSETVHHEYQNERIPDFQNVVIPKFITVSPEVKKETPYLEEKTEAKVEENIAMPEDRGNYTGESQNYLFNNSLWFYYYTSMFPFLNQGTPQNIS